MTDPNLPALREAVAKMTEGPWRNIGDGFVGHGDFAKLVCSGTDLQDMTIADINGIVALRNAAPALLDELEQLRASEKQAWQAVKEQR
jgi:hypothetical protein